ncbi:ead/Ea22-like family protein [Salmonella sp. NW96]|uniref:ead/Ea22-like family protein n=1 Tax=Salmonella sp. NW96 TaxID=2948444 RepID=UPI003F436034
MKALNKQALRDSALDMIRVLGYIASFESEDIDGDDLDLRFETEDGFDTGCTISITSQCQDASDVMQQLLNELEAEKNMREAAEKRIAELEAQSAPESFSAIGKNILSQDNRITSDPMFCVYQKREIVVDADYDYGRIVWVDEDGNEANECQRMRLELLHENFREPPEKWRRVALKEIDDFVTCCFTEQGCKDYLACNGHNLRLPFIYVKSGFRNAEFISVRNWLAGIGVKGE